MPEGVALHSNFMGQRANASLKVASGVWTVSAEAANVRQVDLQLLDGNGAPLKQKRIVRVVVFSTPAKTALATGGSTGLAADTGTLIIATHTAKLVFEILTDANGLMSLTWTDTGTESVVVQAEIDGIVIDTAAFANA